MLVAIFHFHSLDLVLLAFLFEFVELVGPIRKDLSVFSDLVFEGGALVLEADRDFSNLPVDHGLTLAFHQVAQIL